MNHVVKVNISGPVGLLRKLCDFGDMKPLVLYCAKKADKWPNITKQKGENEMKIHIWKGLPEGELLKKIYVCPQCGLEVPSLKCRIIDVRKPNQADNWIEICQECQEEEVKKPC